MCDKDVSARIKGKLFKVRKAMLYDLESGSRKKQDAELEVAELKMLRFSFGVTNTLKRSKAPPSLSVCTSIAFWLSSSANEQRREGH